MIDQRDLFLKGTYVDLKVLTYRDIEDSNWYGWFNDQSLMSGIASQHIMPNSKEKQIDYLKSINQSNDQLVLGIVPKDLDEIVGVVSLKNINHFLKAASHAQIIGNPNFRTFPISFESNKLIFDHAFLGLGLRRIFGGSINPLQVEFMCRFYGFRKEGILKCAEFKNGEFVDVHLIGMLRDEYHPVELNNKVR